MSTTPPTPIPSGAREAAQKKTNRCLDRLNAKTTDDMPKEEKGHYVHTYAQQFAKAEVEKAYREFEEPYFNENQEVLRELNVARKERDTLLAENATLRRELEQERNMLDWVATKLVADLPTEWFPPGIRHVTRQAIQNAMKGEGTR